MNIAHHNNNINSSIIGYIHEKYDSIFRTFSRIFLTEKPINLLQCYEKKYFFLLILSLKAKKEILRDSFYRRHTNYDWIQFFLSAVMNKLFLFSRNNVSDIE